MKKIVFALSIACTLLLAGTQVQAQSKIGYFSVDQMVKEKQNRLFGPLYKKVGDALRAVAKEKGYAYVVDKSVFLVAPDGDDLLPMVAARLKVTLPASMTQKVTPPKQ